MTDQAEPKKVTMILPADLHKRLKLASVEDNTTVTAIIESLVRAYLENRTRKADK